MDPGDPHRDGPAPGHRYLAGQVWGILLTEVVRWRRTRSWITCRDPGGLPKRTRIIGHYKDSPENITAICADELGPVTLLAFPPAPGWSPDGHRIKAELEKAWGYGDLPPGDHHDRSLTASTPRSSSNCWRTPTSRAAS